MINDRLIDQAHSDLRNTCGGVREDYFGLLYLEQEHKVPRGKAVNQIAFGGNDYGFMDSILTNNGAISISFSSSIRTPTVNSRVPCSDSLRMELIGSFEVPTKTIQRIRYCCSFGVASLRIVRSSTRSAFASFSPATRKKRNEAKCWTSCGKTSKTRSTL